MGRIMIGAKGDLRQSPFAGLKELRDEVPEFTAAQTQEIEAKATELATAVLQKITESLRHKLTTNVHVDSDGETEFRYFEPGEIKKQKELLHKWESDEQKLSDGTLDQDKLLAYAKEGYRSAIKKSKSK